jgi:hypothetical protein
MVISNSRDFIFLHIPKCGGTSITQLLDVDVRWNDIVVGGTIDSEKSYPAWSARFRLGKHALPCEIEAALGSETYARFRKFVVVRNPIDRVRSVYKFIRGLCDQRPPWFVDSSYAAAVGEITNIEEFLEGRFFRTALATDPREASEIQRYVLPQFSYVDEAESVRGGFEYFRLEDLQRTTQLLSNAGYIESERPLTKENASPDFESDLDQDALALLRTVYAVDLEYFRYDLEEGRQVAECSVEGD